MDGRPALENPSEIFRHEALDHRDRPLTVEGEPLRLSGAGMEWALWSLVAVVAALIVVGALTKTEEVAQGLAVIRRGAPRAGTGPSTSGAGESPDGGSPRACLLVAYLPARHKAALHPGARARFILPGLGEAKDLRIDFVETQLVSAEEADRSLGRQTSPPDGEARVIAKGRIEPWVVQSGDRAPGCPEGLIGRIEVATGSSSVLRTLIPGLRRDG